MDQGVRRKRGTVKGKTIRCHPAAARERRPGVDGKGAAACVKALRTAIHHAESTRVHRHFACEGTAADELHKARSVFGDGDFIAAKRVAIPEVNIVVTGDAEGSPITRIDRTAAIARPVAGESDVASRRVEGENGYAATGIAKIDRAARASCHVVLEEGVASDIHAGCAITIDMGKNRAAAFPIANLVAGEIGARPDIDINNFRCCARIYRAAAKPLGRCHPKSRRVVDETGIATDLNIHTGGGIRRSGDSIFLRGQHGDGAALGIRGKRLVIREHSIVADDEFRRIAPTAGVRSHKNRAAVLVGGDIAFVKTRTTVDAIAAEGGIVADMDPGTAARG